MQFLTTLWQALGRAAIVCALIRCIPASCNISRIDILSKSPRNFPTFHGRRANNMCNLESYAFVPGSAGLSSFGRKAENYVNFGKEELLSNGVGYSAVARPYFTPLGMKGVDSEGVADSSKLPGALRDSKSWAALKGDFLTSRVRDLKNSVSEVSKGDLVELGNKLGVVGLWYLGSVFYGLENKKALSFLPLPRTVWALQTLLGFPFVAYRWLLGMEKPPRFYETDFRPEHVNFRTDGLLGVVKKGLKNTFGRLGAVVRAHKTVLLQGAYGALAQVLTSSVVAAGSVGFLSLLRAVEPLFSSFFSYFFEGFKMPSLAYLSLLPVAFGVSYATYGSFDFSSVPFVSTLLTNALNALKRLESKRFFGQSLEKVGRNLSPLNMHTAVTLATGLMLAPLALSEKRHWNDSYFSLMKKLKGGNFEFFKHLLLSSLGYALVTHASFAAVSSLSPVTQSLANSLKSVLTMLTNSFLYDYHLTKQELYGSGLAIAGTLLYTLLSSNR